MGQIKDYDAGSWFTATEYAPRDLRGLVAVLDQVRRDPQAFIVRGELAPETKELLSKYQNYHIRRRKLARPNQPATLLEVDRQWLPLDIDGWPLRQCDDLADSPELTIEHAICELLPKPFHDVECAWQLSSSAGFKPGFLKVHLYYWLNEPASNATLKAVLRQCAPVVDGAPFSATQPLFIADPRLEGAPDPLPRRVGWLKGVEESVVLPRLEPNKPRAKAAWASTSRSIGDGAETLDKLGDGEGGLGFHAVLRAETMRYARRCARGYIIRNDAELIARLLGAIEAAPRRSDRGDPLTTYGETYLQRIIDGAFSRVSADPEGQAIKPHHVVGSAQTLEDARAALKQHICGFFERALKFHAARAAEETSTELPEHAGLIVGVGAGKSTAARAALPWLHRERESRWVATSCSLVGSDAQTC